MALEMKYFKISMWLLVVLRFSSGNFSTKYKTRGNCTIKSGSELQEHSLGSFSACIGSCRAVEGCISVSWNSQTSGCLFSSADTISEYTLRHYEQAAGWICASPQIYPVFNSLMTTYSSAYDQMTFGEATTRCTDLGTTLASVNDVTATQSLGLNFCQCGWLSGGGNALIVPVANNTCNGDNIIVGPIWCNNSFANAWCKN